MEAAAICDDGLKMPILFEQGSVIIQECNAERRFMMENTINQTQNTGAVAAAKTQKDVYEYLRNAKYFTLSTVDGDQPCARILSAVAFYGGRIYVYTNKQKAVFDQIRRNPKFEIFCMGKNSWLRLRGKLVADERQEAKQAMIDQNERMDDLKPALSYLYSSTDADFVPLYMRDCSAAFFSFSKSPEAVIF